MPLSLLTYHLIGEADQHCKAPEIPAPRRSSPHHSNLHRRSVCTEHSSAIQSHCKTKFTPWPHTAMEAMTSWTKIIVGRDIPEIQLLCNTYNISVTDNWLPASTYQHTTAALEVWTRTNTKACFCLAKPCI